MNFSPGGLSAGWLSPGIHAVPDDFNDKIRENAEGPAKASGDAGIVEQHRLSDQIEVDKIWPRKKPPSPRVVACDSTSSCLRESIDVWNWLANVLRPSSANGDPRLLRPRTLRARYDAATTTADNRRHWENADGLSANAANRPDVRCTLRNRARYEVANNSYARGIILTLANDVVGTGPRCRC